ncbi:MAG: four helix bundle protein [bacterium]|nr:four helix bundle protein [bacterium]
MARFRFEDLEIWKMAIDTTDTLFDIADQLEKRHLFRFAEQLRGAGLSISNNIAEGSGSSSKKDFSNFLNIARRSNYECANILYVLAKRKLIDQENLAKLLDDLVHLSKKITNFQKALWR